MKKKTILAFALSTVMALAVAAPVAMVNTSFAAMTQSEIADRAAVLPNSLPAVKTIGFNELNNSNFTDPGGIKERSQYGGPWAFSHNDELGGNAAAASTYEITNIDDAVAGMGADDGRGPVVTTALKITSQNGNESKNSTALRDSLTYSSLDDHLYGDRADTARYFSAWVKSEVAMWIDVGISYGATSGVNIYYDLGRKFFIPAGEWTQIGMDEEGNFLPFRAKVDETTGVRGNGSETTAANSNSATAELNAKENAGDTVIQRYYRENWGQVWACMRLYAYAANQFTGDAETTGVGVPTGTSGFEKGESYMVAATNFWAAGSVSDFKQGIETITLDKATANMVVGDDLDLQATVTPNDVHPERAELNWESSDETVATVDQEGKVTAVGVGTATITVMDAEAGAITDECVITVAANPAAVTGVTLNKITLTLKVGATEKLTPTVAPTTATNKNVTWKSSNESVATVDAQGNVKAIKEGTAVITVTTADGSKTAECAVTVEKATTNCSGASTIGAGGSGLFIMITAIALAGVVLAVWKKRQTVKA